MNVRIYKNIKNVVIIIFFLISFSVKTETLSNISGLEKLENYNEIKNIEVKRIADYDKELAKRNGKAYDSENNEIFTGVGVQKVNGLIRYLYFYENGVINKVYKYYLDGKIEEIQEFKNGIPDGLSEKYDKNGKPISRTVSKDGYLKKKEEYNTKGKLTMEYKEIDKNHGVFVYYDEKGKKVLVESEMLQVSYQGNIYTIPDGSMKVYGRNGKVEREYNYKNGRMEGQEQKVYYPNGKLKYYTIAKTNDMRDPGTSKVYIAYYTNGREEVHCNEKNKGETNGATIWKCEYFTSGGKSKEVKEYEGDIYSRSFSTTQYEYDNTDAVDFFTGIAKIPLVILEAILGSY